MRTDVTHHAVLLGNFLKSLALSFLLYCAMAGATYGMYSYFSYSVPSAVYFLIALMIIKIMKNLFP